MVDRADETELKEVARYRLAEVLLNDKQYDEALKVLDAKHGEPFAGLYADLRGDALAAAGRADDARAAYALALAKLDAKSQYRTYVQVKLDSLGGAPAAAGGSAGDPPPPPAAARPAPAAPPRPRRRRRLRPQPPHPHARAATHPGAPIGNESRPRSRSRSRRARRLRDDLRVPARAAVVLAALALGRQQEAGAAAGTQGDGRPAP